MFTGLVEKAISLKQVLPVEGGASLCFDSPFEGVKLGDSIAINGCCLTVSTMKDGELSFDILTQTLRVTNLGLLKEGSLVNVERAMKAEDRLGGHLVSGHIDACGEISFIKELGQDHQIGLVLPEEQCRYCIDKGSLTLDGISLTIAEIKGQELIFWITPHTWAFTHLHSLSVGSVVNVEVDMLAKYVEKLIHPHFNRLV